MGFAKICSIGADNRKASDVQSVRAGIAEHHGLRWSRCANARRGKAQARRTERDNRNVADSGKLNIARTIWRIAGESENSGARATGSGAKDDIDLAVIGGGQETGTGVVVDGVITGNGRVVDLEIGRAHVDKENGNSWAGSAFFERAEIHSGG